MCETSKAMDNTHNTERYYLFSCPDTNRVGYSEKVGQNSATSRSEKLSLHLALTIYILISVSFHTL